MANNRNEDPSWGGGWCLQADHKDIDPRLIGTTCRSGLQKYHPLTSPSISQKKVTHPVALIPNFAVKNSFLKTILEVGSFEREPSVLCAWSPEINLCLVQTTMLVFVWPHCASNIGTWIWQHFCIFPRWLSGEESALVSIPGSERSSGGGNGNPFQYFCLENFTIEEPGRLHSMGSQRGGHN